MALGDGTRRIRTPSNGAGDIHLHLPPKRGPAILEEPEEAKSRIELMFEQLGSDDRVRVHRLLEEGGEKYSGILPVSSELADDLEETIARKFGGGRYRLIGWSKGKNVCSAYVDIDTLMFGPPKSREEIKAAAAPPAPAAPAVDPIALMQKFEELLEKRVGSIEARRAPAPAPDPNAMLIPILTAMVDNQTKLAMAAFQAAQRPAAEGKSEGDPFAQLKSMASVAESLGFKRPGEGENRPLTDQLLLRAADHAGEFAVKMFDAKAKSEAAKSAPAPAASPTMPQQAARIPAEAKPLDAATVEKLRASIQRPGASAPSGRDVMPEAKK